MVEHLGGNMWHLEEGEYVGTDPKNGIVGPGIVRLDDHTGSGLIGVQGSENYIEIDGQELGDFEKAVKQLPAEA